MSKSAVSQSNAVSQLTNLSVMPANDIGRMIPISEMCILTSKSRATLYRWVLNGFFPAPKMVNGRNVGWHQYDFLKWCSSQCAIG